MMCWSIWTLWQPDRSESCFRTSRFARSLTRSWQAGPSLGSGALRGMPHVREKRGEWTVLDSTVQFSNPWITVREDRVIQPDGKEGAFGVAEMIPGVSVLPVDDDGTVYLVRVYRYTIDRHSLEALAGGIE